MFASEQEVTRVGVIGYPIDDLVTPKFRLGQLCADELGAVVLFHYFPFCIIYFDYFGVQVDIGIQVPINIL